MQDKSDGSLFETSQAIVRFIETNGPTSTERLCLGVGVSKGRCRIALAWLICRELVVAQDDHVFVSPRAE